MYSLLNKTMFNAKAYNTQKIIQKYKINRLHIHNIIRKKNTILLTKIQSQKINHSTIHTLNDLYYVCSPLTGDELRALVVGRRMQFSNTENGIELYIFPEKADYDDITWNGLSDILNAWYAGDQIRNKAVALELHKDILHIIPVFIPASMYYDDEDYQRIIEASF